MMFIGLLLAAAAAAFTADVAYETTGNVTFNALNRTFTMSEGWAAIGAVLVGVIGMLGIWTLLGGMIRARRRRAVVVEHRRAAEDLEDDRNRLAGELERERRARIDAEHRADQVTTATTTGDLADATDRSDTVSGPARSKFDMMPAEERTDA